MDWITSSKTQPCPVCGRTKDKDCTWASDLLTVLCHTPQSSNSEVPQPPTEINGYKATGKVSKGGYCDRMTYVMADSFQKQHKPSAPAVYFDYPTLEGEPLVRVARKETGKGKRIWQESWDGQDWIKTVSAEVKEQIHLYRITDPVNKKAIGHAYPLLIVEGEALVDRLLSLGIAATTAIGGAGKWRQYGGASGNYAQDLKDAVKVICPDRDKPGIEHALEIASDYYEVKWLYANPTHYAWNNPFIGNGYDLGDWIDELEKEGKGQGEIVNLLIESIEPPRTFETPEVKPEPSTSTRDGGLDPDDEVSIGTIDDHIYCRLFGGGTGDYITLNDAFYKYSGKGFWSRLEDRQVFQLIGQQCRKAYKLRRNSRLGATDVTFPYAKDGAIKSAFNFSRSLLDVTGKLPYNNHLMCFENGVIDLRTGEMHKHSSEHFLTSTITADYQANQECPEVFYEFICSAFGEDLIEVIQAVTSMFLDPTAPYGRFVHIIGPSGSGKGTLLRLWLEMFGMDATRSIGSFSELATPEGRHQSLSGVKLCVLPDVGGYLQGLKAFYELVDNGPMSGRALFSPSAYQAKWNVRFATASVDHLQIENSGDGWDRRVIPLPTKPRQGAMNSSLSAELSRVKGQIVSWALSMPHERRDWVLNNLNMFERIEAARADASVSGDPIRYFVDLCLRPSEDAEKVQHHTLHTWYEAFCAAHGYQRMSMNRFISHLKTVLPVHFQPRRRALAEEDPDRARIPAHWSQLEPLPAVFEYIDKDVAKCIKSRCQEGGLFLFSDYANQILNGNICYKNGPGGPRLTPKKSIDPGPHETLENKDFQQNGPGGPGGPGSISAVENLCNLTSNQPDRNEEDVCNLLGTPPSYPGPPGPPGPLAQNPHEMEVFDGPRTSEKLRDREGLILDRCVSADTKLENSVTHNTNSSQFQFASAETLLKNVPPCTDPNPPFEGYDLDGNYWHQGRRVLDYTPEEFEAYEGEF